MLETCLQSLGQEDLWRREWQPTPVFLLGKSHEQRSLVGYSPWGHKESDTLCQFSSLEWIMHLDCSVIVSICSLNREGSMMLKKKKKTQKIKVFTYIWPQGYLSSQIVSDDFLHISILPFSLVRENLVDVPSLKRKKYIFIFLNFILIGG